MAEEPEENGEHKGSEERQGEVSKFEHSVWIAECLDVDRSLRSQDHPIFSTSNFRTSLMTLREMLDIN
jgi:hypothetical protein